MSFFTQLNGLTVLFPIIQFNKSVLYHYGFSDYFLHLYCYFQNVLADMSSGLLQVFVELGKRNGYRHWFPKFLRRQSSSDCRFNPDYRRMTMQEYLTLVSGYG